MIILLNFLFSVSANAQNAKPWKGKKQQLLLVMTML
jgi:hypothetical protein